MSHSLAASGGVGAILDCVSADAGTHASTASLIIATSSKQETTASDSETAAVALMMSIGRPMVEDEQQPAGLEGFLSNTIAFRMRLNKVRQPPAPWSVRVPTRLVRQATCSLSVESKMTTSNCVSMKAVRTDDEIECTGIDAGLRARGVSLVTLPDGVSEDALCLAAADAGILLVCYTPITSRVIDAAAKLRASLNAVSVSIRSTYPPQCGAASPSSTYRNTPRRRSPKVHLH